MPNAPQPSSMCGKCDTEIGYEPATLCLGCATPFHEDCFGVHECPAVVRQDAAKLGAWTRAAGGWDA